MEMKMIKKMTKSTAPMNQPLVRNPMILLLCSTVVEEICYKHKLARSNISWECYFVNMILRVLQNQKVMRISVIHSGRLEPSTSKGDTKNWYLLLIFPEKDYFA